MYKVHFFNPVPLKIGVGLYVPTEINLSNKQL